MKEACPVPRVHTLMLGAMMSPATSTQARSDPGTRSAGRASGQVTSSSAPALSSLYSSAGDTNTGRPVRKFNKATVRRLLDTPNILRHRNGLTNCGQIWCLGRGSLTTCFPKVMGICTCALAHPLSYLRNSWKHYAGLCCRNRLPT